MKVGIVGKPNVGKSAFFRSLTLADVDSQNYPFTTIDANSAMGYVRVKDPAVEFGKHSHPREGYVLGDWRFVPVEIIDVAGLVPGAHEGKGLGNKFLDDLRQADALIHVIDLSGSTNEKGEPVELNSYDPAEDIRFLENELDHWFYNIIEKHWENISKKVRMQDMKIEVALANVLSGLNISEEQINNGIRVLNLDKTNIGDNLFDLAKTLRKFSKPIVIAANKCDVLSKEEFDKKTTRLGEEFNDLTIIPVIAEYEWNLKKAHENNIVKYIPGEKEFEIIDENSLSSQQIEGLNKISDTLTHMSQGTGVQEAINYSIFNLLKMKPIFPGGSKLEDDKGNVLPDCFIMDENATALDFAYQLHTDFGKNFIKAVDIKTKKMVGKDHPLDFGDVIEIISGK